MNYFFIIVGVALIVYILAKVIKRKFDAIESIFWMIGSIFILVLSIWPNIIIWLAQRTGIEYPPSLLFLLVAIFLLLINFRNTQKISDQNQKIVYLGQEVAILKNQKSSQNSVSKKEEKNMKSKKYDVLVIGAGFAGATIANKMANTGKKVLIIDKRPHIGGNMYECDSSNGVRIHLYGPHIFHTNSQKVFDYLKQFAKFYPYEHRVIGNIDGKLVPVPFNYKSLETLFNPIEAKMIEEKLNAKYGKDSKVSIYSLINDEDEIIKEFGNYVYDKVFAQYTAKQWEIPIEKIDNSVINRVPVVLGYDDKYFKDTIQYMPEEGFTKLIENMLNHENIDIKVSTMCSDVLELDFDTNKTYLFGQEFSGKIFFTGAVDELLEFKYGALPYRSLNLVFEDYKTDYYQTNSVVNYNTSEKFTRITEFKYLTKQQIKNKTTILKEYPLKYNHLDKTSDPYYPINNEENLALYEKYKADIQKFNNIYLCGRLAEYKYYNMDAVVERVLDLFEELGEVE